MLGPPTFFLLQILRYSIPNWFDFYFALRLAFVDEPDVRIRTEFMIDTQAYVFTAYQRTGWNELVYVRHMLDMEDVYEINMGARDFAAAIASDMKTVFLNSRREA